MKVLAGKSGWRKELRKITMTSKMVSNIAKVKTAMDTAQAACVKDRFSLVVEGRRITVRESQWGAQWNCDADGASVKETVDDLANWILFANGDC
jgi:hypothetical protein